MIQKESIQIESFKSSTQHSSVNDFVIINILEEDVKIRQITLDSDDQSMWESAKTVAPTPDPVITRPDVDENFVIKSTHLKMIWENKFDGYPRADPHDHIREFLTMCDKFKYGETQSETIKLFIFPFSLCDKAKTWFNELNEESITSSFSQNECESLTDAWLRLKSMLRICHGHGLTKGAIIQIFYHGLDEPTQGILEKTAGGIFLYKSPNQAFQFLDDKVLFKLDWSTKSQNEHHRKFVAFTDGSNSNDENYQLMEILEVLTIKMDSQIISLKEELQDMRNKYYDLKDNHASKSRMTDPPPPQAHTEQVNAVFTGSGKSDDSPKIQKDPPPPIIVNNKAKKDKHIKTSKRMVVKEIECILLEEIEKFRWWFEQDIDGEKEDDNKNKLVMVNEEEWMS
ncbi:hypothetical protein Tco_0621701 [Tanacetum coccineum]